MKKEIIVIGAGIIGLATAERLLREGASVTLIERNRTGQESSWAGGGILSPLYPWEYPDEINHLTQHSASLFPEWTAALHRLTGIDCELETSGMLVLPPYDKRSAQQWCIKQGVRTELNTTIVNSNFPSDALNKALFLPEISQVRSPRLLSALHQKIKILGGQIIEYCAAQNFIVKNNEIQSLNTSCGSLTANQYIITAGAWSTEILGQHALNLKIKPIQGQMLLFKFDSPPLRTILLQHGLYMIPRKDGYLLIGSTLEDVGFNKSTTQTAYIKLIDWAKKLLPQLNDKQILQHWAGLRPASSHNAPTIGKHPILQNLYVNTGHFRYGVTMAPASAEILLNEMTNKTQPFDTSPYKMGQ